MTPSTSLPIESPVQLSRAQAAIDEEADVPVEDVTPASSPEVQLIGEALPPQSTSSLTAAQREKQRQEEARRIEGPPESMEAEDPAAWQVQRRSKRKFSPPRTGRGAGSPQIPQGAGRAGRAAASLPPAQGARQPLVSPGSVYTVRLGRVRPQFAVHRGRARRPAVSRVSSGGISTRNPQVSFAAATRQPASAALPLSLRMEMLSLLKSALSEAHQGASSTTPVSGPAVQQSSPAPSSLPASPSVIGLWQGVSPVSVSSAGVMSEVQPVTPQSGPDVSVPTAPSLQPVDPRQPQGISPAVEYGVARAVEAARAAGLAPVSLPGGSGSQPMQSTSQAGGSGSGASGSGSGTQGAQVAPTHDEYGPQLAALAKAHGAEDVTLFQRPKQLSTSGMFYSQVYRVSLHRVATRRRSSTSMGATPSTGMPVATRRSIQSTSQSSRGNFSCNASFPHCRYARKSLPSWQLCRNRWGP